MARLWGVLFSCLLVASACSSEESEESVREASGLISDIEMDVDGTVRTFDVYLPRENHDEPPRALVVLLHGNRSSKEDLSGASFATSPYELWQPLADTENYALLIPQGSDGTQGDAGWNDCRSDASGNPTSDDVEFLAQAVQQVTADWNIDPANTFAVGTSNGGHMAQRLADERPDLVRGIGVIAAGVTASSQCTVSNEPVAALFMWGTEDPIAPFDGGEMAGDRGQILSAEASITRWVDRNGLTKDPAMIGFADLDREDESTVVRLSYREEGRFPVEFYQIVGGGHTEPSVSAQYRRVFERIVGRQNHDIEMADEIWAFFADLLQ